MKSEENSLRVMRRPMMLALCGVGFVAVPLLAAAAKPAASYQPPKSQARAQIVWVKPICVEKNRYIGWPTVCRLANGDLMAVFSGDRDEHVCPFGKVQMVRSSDEGKTWTDPVTIANGPIDDRDAGIVQLPDGEIFVTYFTSVAYRAPGILARHPDYKRFDDALSDDVRRASLGNWAVRSRDNGKTWTKPEKLSMKGQTPHGPILLRDGSLLQFGRYFAGRTVISCERSTDGGRTWEMLCSDVPDVNGENAKGQMFHEPHVVELADGTLVGMVRYHGADNCMRETVSKDGGRTWTPMAKSPLVGLPPHLIRLADGKIVCVYGRRLKSPGFGEFAAISDDGGATWDYENEISLAPSHCGDLGYPASCVLANGDILTVFYQQPEPGQKPCLMAARWMVKDDRSAEMTIADFTEPHKWGGPHHVADVSSSAEGLSFTVTDEDPWFIGPLQDISSMPAAVKVSRLVMTCAPTSRASAWQVFYAAPGEGFNEARSFHLHPVGKAPYTKFMSQESVPSTLHGRYRFRLDPPRWNGSFTVKKLSLVAPLWSYEPQQAAPLVIPESTRLVLKGDGWELRHDPGRIGAFRFTSHGKSVENLPAEPFVYLDKSGKVRTLDWYKAKMTAVLDKESLSTEAQMIDADGRRWKIIRAFMLDKTSGALVVRTLIAAASPNDEKEPAKVLHVPALTLFVDRASNGHKHQAMLAGVEYLDDEPSSNTKEIRTHEHNRLIPAEYRLSAPMAVFTKDGSWLAAVWMEWEKIRKSGAGPSQCATVFDTPDRLFKSGGHLLAFWAPAVGQARAESELDVYEPVPFRTNTTFEHVVLFKAGAGESVADAIEGWLSGKALLPPDKIDSTAALEQMAHGWLDSAIREGVKVKHAIGGRFTANLVADAPVLMQHLAAAIDREPKGDKALAARLRATSAEILAAVPKRDVGFTGVSHIRRPAPVLVAGDVPNWLARKNAELKSANVSLASGKRIWKPQPGRPDFGETLGADHCNGYTAMALDGLMGSAVWSGDEGEIAKALAIVDKFTTIYHGTVPRGAQPWEMPLHTPDIMASAHIVRIYTLAYLLRPDPAYLREARHWAYGGLSMVYLGPPPFDFGEGVNPVGKYATCAVMGATHWVAPNWIGRPVQWCGLVYSAALWDLARIETDAKAREFWRTVADGITVSGARQNHTADEPNFVGLLPDSWNLERQTQFPIPINPGTVQENFAEHVRLPFYSLRALPRAGGAPALVHAAGNVEVLESANGALRCRVAAWPQAPSKVVVTRVAKPREVKFGGAPAKFEYIPERRALVVEVPSGADGVLEIHFT